MEGYSKVFAGEDPQRVITWMADRGIPYNEAKKCVDEALFEKKHGGRRDGVLALFKGGGLIVISALLFGLSRLLGGIFILPLIMAGAFLVGIGYLLVGLFQIVTNVELS